MCSLYFNICLFCICLYSICNLLVFRHCIEDIQVFFSKNNGRFSSSGMIKNIPRDYNKTRVHKITLIFCLFYTVGHFE